LTNKAYDKSNIQKKSKQAPALSHTRNAKICMEGVILKEHNENSSG